MNSGDAAAAVAARPCPALPGDPVHPAAATAITTPSKAHKIGLAAFLQASRPVLPCGTPPAEGIRLWRRSQNQFISSPSQWAWCGDSKRAVSYPRVRSA